MAAGGRGDWRWLRLLEQSAAAWTAGTTVHSLTVSRLEVQDQVWQGWFLPTPLLGTEMAALALCPHTVVPLCVSVPSSPLPFRTPGIS